jgi:hypothetical protein
MVTQKIDFNRNRQESQMYSSLTAVVLCIATQTAAAQCVDPAPAAQHVRHSADLIKKKGTAAASTPGDAHPAGGLIKTAAASTQDEVPIVSRSAPAAMASATAGDEQRHRGGPAMLLTALALMLGIALRRFGTHSQ